MESVNRFHLAKRLAFLLILILAIVIPLSLGGYLTSILILISIWSMVALSLNLVFGYTGQLSLGQSAFVGTGAYSLGLLTVKVGMGFWPAFALAVIISGVFGLAIGFPALRAKGPYFVLVTLGFAVIVGVVVLAWAELTGGANGLPGVPRPDSIPLPWGRKFDFESDLHMYYLILFFLVVITGIIRSLVNSLVGKTFLAISHDENLAESVGINAASRKVLSFTISAIIAGIAGALYASYNRVISPDIAYFTKSMDALVFLIVGGVQTMAGPYLGTLVMFAVPEVLQVVPELNTLLHGVILMIFVIFLPSGMVGGFSRLSFAIGRLWDTNRKNRTRRKV